MVATSLLSSSSASFNSRETRFDFPNASSASFCYVTSFRKWPRLLFSCRCPSPSPRTSPLSIAHVLENPTIDSLIPTSNSKDMLPKIDKSGRFCSPRAARELALMILYAACLDGSDPVRLFEKRLNARRETGYEFDKAYLMEYNHMSFGGPPVTAETPEEADEILRNDQRESDIVLHENFWQRLRSGIVNVLAIDKVAPHNWKNEPAGRILEFSVLHLAMSEMAVLGTRHQIVINEAVDLAKRFCDGAAPRIINGCLRNFLKELKENDGAENVEIKQTV
ncbi:UNVERIFIED_CONTAM: hypothetical protein Sradi_0317700 [Sesamum radiatum]|uniref:NusB/RsmB/TIM44 domain-containing protein n=1 Tax=Sesamum radiatum TaxID=300843 RepID=A0AAW2W3W0_SESRA